jgi:hypothetical protein
MKLTRAPRLSTVMVSRTIIPSWEAAGQQALVWLEIRLPSPKTTSLPPMMRMGWTMCTCWPTIAVMAGERVSCWARWSWKLLGWAASSSPQCRLTMTTCAPSRRARRASEMIRGALARLTDQGCGEPMPLVNSV